MTRSLAAEEVGDPRVSQHAEPDVNRADFGANTWLVDELYEQYLQDKTAVDPAWWDFFEGYKPSAPATTTSGAVAAGGDAGSTGGNGVVESAPAAPAAPGASGDAPTPREAADRPAPGAPAGERPGTVAAPVAERPAPTGGEVPPAPAPEATRPQEQPAPRDPEPAPTTSPVATAQPATAPYAPAAKAAREAEQEAPEATDETQRLRGPAARVVTNMEASLEVPTATSVRAIPAKLLVDNRIVINNHLARGRGGKLGVEDFAGTTLSLTNPGTIGTVHSVPRLMQGQGTIIGVGAMDYPAEFQGTSDEQ